jgi:hypothetical protein
MWQEPNRAYAREQRARVIRRRWKRAWWFCEELGRLSCALPSPHTEPHWRVMLARRYYRCREKRAWRAEL